MSLVLRLQEISRSPRDLVGGKAASLAKMAQAGVPIPPTVCVTTEAYTAYVDKTGLRDRILIELERKPFQEMRWEELWDASLRLRNMFLTTPPALDIRDEVVTGVNDVFPGAALVVRSSAQGEDSAALSFAGAHESFLNIRGRDGLWDHVLLVWASLFSDRALLYQRELGLDPRSSAMAVVVQEMIQGSRSGVIFSMSPLDPKRAVIEAAYGLNQGLVDGEVEPSRWILERNTGEIVSFQPPIETGAGSDGVSLRNAGLPLNGTETLEVFRLGRRTEMLFGSPQDVEWTYRDSVLIALQSRPVTTGQGAGDDRAWYITLRRSYANLLTLRDEMENELLPKMELEAAALGAVNLKSLSDDGLCAEAERRKGILDYWEKEYVDKCIPFAHGVRLFAEVYNDHVRPADPFEFVDLLHDPDMLSVKRNASLRELAQGIREDPDSLRCLREDHVESCGENVQKLLARWREAFGVFSWDSANLLEQSRQLADLLEAYISMGPQSTFESAQAKVELAGKFVETFPESEREYAAKLLDLARSSYRLRDDDNIYIGKIRRRFLEAEEERECRSLTVCPIGPLPQKPVSTSGSQPFTSEEQTGSPSSLFRVQARQIVGQPAGPGVATGKARVIRTSEDLFTFQPQEILICDAIDPNMTFVAPLAAGIVERRGGMLIHGAIIAREYGIPCVTGIPRATEVIHTGERVTVDGFLGLVIIG